MFSYCEIITFDYWNLRFSKLKYYIILLVITTFIGCGQSQADFELDEEPQNVLRVITMENAFSYYVDDEGNEYGYDYDLSVNLADYLDCDLQLIIANSEEEMVNLLIEGKGDLIAYRLPKSVIDTGELTLVSSRSFHSHPVLVQRREKNRINSQVDLIGKTVWVKEKQYVRRLQNLNDELGAVIDIRQADDTTKTEGLIYRVSKGKLDYVVADSYLVDMLSARLQNIDMSLALGFEQQKSWVVHKSDTALMNAIDEWGQQLVKSNLLKQLYGRYVLNVDYFDNCKIQIPDGAVSPYDKFFKKAALVIDWDWRMLAALAWNESHFNPYAQSSQGAMGIMQMMPRTAARFGLNDTTIHDPYQSIMAGAQYIKHIDMIFKSVHDSEERIKFILAGYNAGPGHILDAMALARKWGYDPYLWDDVALFLLRKSDAKYYNDEVVRHGYFRGKHTVGYVDKVYKTYNEYCEKQIKN